MEESGDLKREKSFNSPLSAHKQKQPQPSFYMQEGNSLAVNRCTSNDKIEKVKKTKSQKKETHDEDASLLQAVKPDEPT